MAVFEGKICALPQNIVTLQHIWIVNQEEQLSRTRDSLIRAQDSLIRNCISLIRSWDSLISLRHLVALDPDGRTDGIAALLADDMAAVDALLEVGLHEEVAIGIAVNNTDTDIVVFLTLHQQGLLRAHIDGVLALALLDDLIDGLLQDVDIPLALLLIEVEADGALVELAARDGEEDIADDIVFVGREEYATLGGVGRLLLLRSAIPHDAWGWHALANDGLGFVLLTDHDLSEFDDLILQDDGELLAIGIVLVGEHGGEVGHVGEDELLALPLGDGEQEAALGIGDGAYGRRGLFGSVVLEAYRDVFYAFTALIDDVALDGGLPLPYYTDEGQQHG